MNKYRVTYLQKATEKKVIEIEAASYVEAEELVEEGSDNFDDVDGYEFVEISFGDRWLEDIRLIEGEEPEFDVSTLDLTETRWRNEVAHFLTKRGYADWREFKIAEARAGM